MKKAALPARQPFSIRIAHNIPHAGIFIFYVIAGFIRTVEYLTGIAVLYDWNQIREVPRVTCLLSG